ncbi:MAG TPA: hypothetical protein VK694_06990 [Verrucomicrobiae bacterium]|nr:hypothetical protein [Verrucomicrobiae bacterium]
MTHIEGEPLFYYDLFENRMLTGATAYEDALAAGSNPHDFIDLRDALHDPKRYAALVTNEVPRQIELPDQEDLTALAQWVGHEILGERVRVVIGHFKFLHKLSLGASEKGIEKLGGFSALYERAELPNAVRYGLYDSWDINDFADYVYKQETNPDRTKSLTQTLREANLRGEGPGLKTINERTKGGMRRLLTRRGLYIFFGADEDYYEDWGVDFMFANNGRPVDTGVLKLLSPKRLSPGAKTIHARYGTIEKFNLKVEDKYYAEVDRITIRNAHKFAATMQAVNDGDLPTSIMVGCTNEAELRHVVGKYQLLEELCPALEPDQIIEIVQGTTKQALYAIMRRNRDKTAAHIEVAAVRIDVFDDVWPPTPKLALKV